jgi:hypothetical protein
MVEIDRVREGGHRALLIRRSAHGLCANVPVGVASLHHLTLQGARCATAHLHGGAVVSRRVRRIERSSNCAFGQRGVGYVARTSDPRPAGAYRPGASEPRDSLPGRRALVLQEGSRDAGSLGSLPRSRRVVQRRRTTASVRARQHLRPRSQDLRAHGDRPSDRGYGPASEPPRRPTDHRDEVNGGEDGSEHEPTRVRRASRPDRAHRPSGERPPGVPDAHVRPLREPDDVRAAGSGGLVRLPRVRPVRLGRASEETRRLRASR